MRSKILTSATIFLLLLIPVALFAQSTDISVSVSPENPGPGEEVTIRLSSYVDNLDAVKITWVVGGRVALAGIGKKDFTLTAPNLGSSTVVTVQIALPGGTVTEQITVRPAVMVLLWQATRSFVPPFYKGKALLPRDSGVKVVALPEVRKAGGAPVDAKNMIYSWQKDYSNEGEGSGYGKNFFTYHSDFLDPTNNVGVSVSTLDGAAAAVGSIDIPTAAPEIQFYKVDSLGTRFEQTLADNHKINMEETVAAMPFFISYPELGNPRVSWQWFINDFAIDIYGPFKNVIPLKVQEGVTGTSTLRLEVNNIDKVFESATKEINVQF